MTKPNMTAALQETRDLIESMNDVNADGRRLAKDLADSIGKIVDMQCGAIEERITELRGKLETLERQSKA